MKLYKNTLIISMIVFCVCILLSVVFEFTCISKFQVVSFLSDYMIGIACSIIVVIITTFLQFKYEQTKLLNSILFDVHFFFFHYWLIAVSIDPNEKTPDKLWEHYYDEVCDDLKKISSQLSTIQWFSKSKSKIADNLQKAVLRIQIRISACTNKKETLIEILCEPLLKEIKTNTLLLADTDEFTVKEIIRNYEDIQKELETLNIKYYEFW